MQCFIHNVCLNRKLMIVLEKAQYLEHAITSDDMRGLICKLILKLRAIVFPLLQTYIVIGYVSRPVQDNVEIWQYNIISSFIINKI